MSELDPILLSNRLPAIQACVAELSGADRSTTSDALVALVERPDTELLQRISAGNALGMLTDPRIDPLDPEMCRVPASAFEMGTAAEDVPVVARRYGIPEPWMTKSTPRHRVEVDAFEIGRFLVTEREYTLFLEATGYPDRPAHWPRGEPSPHRRNHPIYGVGWQGVLLYVEWVSEATGLQYRIPTEVEWERAARGTDARSFPWGDLFDAGRCNTREGGVGTTTPVGVYPHGASPVGALDLAGNVEEYTADLYRAYPGNDMPDPDYGSYRMTRGGTFSLDADLARCDRRHGDVYGAEIGFRLARSVAAGWSD